MAYCANSEGSILGGLGPMPVTIPPPDPIPAPPARPLDAVLMPAVETLVGPATTGTSVPRRRPPDQPAAVPRATDMGHSAPPRYRDYFRAPAQSHPAPKDKGCLSAPVVRGAGYSPAWPAEPSASPGGTAPAGGPLPAALWA